MLKIITEPTTKPYDMDALKTYLRVLDDFQDTQIAMMADSYLLKAEEITNLILQGITTFEWTIEGGFRDLIVPKNPVTEVVSVEYFAEDGWHSLNLSEHLEMSYPLDATKAPCTLFFSDAPKAEEVRVVFNVGFSLIDKRVEMWLFAKVAEEYDKLEDKQRSKYLDRMLDSLRVHYL